MQAREFQMKQMLDRKKELDDLKRRDQRDAQHDYRKFEGLVKKEREDREREKKKLLDN